MRLLRYARNDGRPRNDRNSRNDGNSRNDVKLNEIASAFSKPRNDRRPRNDRNSRNDGGLDEIASAFSSLAMTGVLTATHSSLRGVSGANDEAISFIKH